MDVEDVVGVSVVMYVAVVVMDVGLEVIVNNVGVEVVVAVVKEAHGGQAP